MLPFIFCIPQINEGQFELDLGIGSSYDMIATRSYYGFSGDGEAKLTGGDLRFLYSSDQTISYGLRLANHEGEDSKGLCCDYAYKISISETSPFVKYSYPFNKEGQTVIEGFVIGGLNSATMKVSHSLTEETSASTTGLMLEGGVFAGMKNNGITFGGGINLPLDTYEGSFSWNFLGYPLEYEATVKKNLSIFLIFKTKI